MLLRFHGVGHRERLTDFNRSLRTLSEPLGEAVVHLLIFLTSRTRASLTPFPPKPGLSWVRAGYEAVRCWFLSKNQLDFPPTESHSRASYVFKSRHTPPLS